MSWNSSQRLKTLGLRSSWLCPPLIEHRHPDDWLQHMWSGTSECRSHNWLSHQHRCCPRTLDTSHRPPPPSSLCKWSLTIIITIILSSSLSLSLVYISSSLSSLVSTTDQCFLPKMRSASGAPLLCLYLLLCPRVTLWSWLSASDNSSCSWN